MPGVGTGGFGTANNSPFSAGPPFPLSAAENGLSVDPVTGRVVLGNDVGAVTAALLSTREIPMSGQTLRLLQNAFRTEMTGDILQIFDAVNTDYAASLGVGTAGVLTLGGNSTTGGSPRMILGDNSPFGAVTTIRQRFTELQVLAGANRMLTANDSTNEYFFGDVDGGMYLFINSGGNQTLLTTNMGRTMQLWNYATEQVLIGDTGLLTTGMNATIDIGAGSFAVANTASNAFYSANGVPGITGTFVAPASITVNGGIVTAVT